MCKCRPEVRTPYCGNGDCIWPRSKPVNARPTQDRREVPQELVEQWWRDAVNKSGDGKYSICRFIINQYAAWARGE